MVVIEQTFEAMSTNFRCFKCMVAGNVHLRLHITTTNFLDVVACSVANG